jgi:hypothetical protein
MSVLKNKDGIRKTYATVYGGKFAIRVKEGTEGATKRKLENGPNKGNTIHEIYLDQATGYVKSTNAKVGKYGQQLEITMVENHTDEEAVVVQFRADTRYGSTLMKRWKNVNFDLPLTLEPYSFPNPDNPDKLVTGIHVVQDGVRYDSLHTQENPNGMPGPEKKKNGKLDWDDQHDFLLKQFESHKPTTNQLPTDTVPGHLSGMGDDAPDAALAR